MAIHRPASNETPGNQSIQTPSGKDVPMGMSMMVDSMVRMIQGANNNQSNSASEYSTEEFDGN